MGRVTTTITVTNHIDEILADRGLWERDRVRSITLTNVLVDTGATRLCLPAEIVRQLGLTLAGEIRGHTVIGNRSFRLFENVKLAIAGRQGRYDCIELPEGEEAIVGLIPLEDMGLELDLQAARLVTLPDRGRDNYLRV